MRLNSEKSPAMKTPRSGKKNNVFYGVWITAAVWAIYFLSATPSAYGSSVVSTQVVLQRGWDEGIVGMGTSIYYLSLAMISIPTSILIKKKGIKSAIYIGTFVGIATYALLILADKPVIYLALFVGIGICCAMTSIVPAPAAINMWYDRNKAMPMAIQVSAGSIGGFLMPIIVQYCAGFGVNLCWLVFLLMNVVTLFITIFVIKNDPKEIGEIPDGRAWTAAHPLSEEEKILHDSREPSLSSCYRSRQFWMLAIQLFGTRAANAGINSYIMLYAIHTGVPEMQAALLITAYNATGLIGRFSVGFLDKLPVKKQVVNVTCLTLIAFGGVLLFLGGGYPMFLVAALCAGFGFGALCALFPLLVPEYFGSGNFPMLNGTFNTLGTLGGFFSPIAIYAIARRMGGYGNSFAALGLMLLFCAVFSALTPVRRINLKNS